MTCKHDMVSETIKDAVRGLVSGVLSGGLRVGGDGTITNTGDKEVADKGFLGRLLGTGE